MPTLTRDQVLIRLKDLQTVPAVYRRLLQILDEPYPSARSVAEVLSSDVALSVRVLRMVNSAFYGVVVPVASVTRAVSLLGLDVLRGVFLCLASYDLFFAGTAPGASRLWRHSLGTAILARELARPLDPRLREELFSAGLLHDVGLAILSGQLPEVWRTYEEALEEGEEALDAEERIFGATHCEVGEWACERWRLPEVIGACVRWHHAPLEAGADQMAACLVHIAMHSWDDPDFRAPHDVLEAVGLDDQAILEARAVAESEFQRLEDALGGLKRREGPADDRGAKRRVLR